MRSGIFPQIGFGDPTACIIGKQPVKSGLQHSRVGTMPVAIILQSVQNHNGLWSDGQAGSIEAAI
jgi:hypothetical protein